MDDLSSLRLRKLTLRIISLLILAKNRSTWLSPELCAGMKWMFLEAFR